MPTGATADNLQLGQLVNFARERKILLINDNPYSFVLNQKPLSLLGIPGSIGVAMELNSFSKTFNMAGWRVGMLLGNKEYINAVLKVKSNMDSGMFYGIQKGAVAALQSGSDWFGRLDAVYRERRKLVFSLAGILGCTYNPEAAGMFVWAKLPPGAPSAEAFINSLLYDKDLFIAPGTIFGRNGEGYVRFSLCVKEERIKEAIARFRD